MAEFIDICRFKCREVSVQTQSEAAPDCPAVRGSQDADSAIFILIVARLASRMPRYTGGPDISSQPLVHAVLLQAMTLVKDTEDDIDIPVCQCMTYMFYIAIDCR